VEKVAIIQPVAKVGTPSGPSAFRPISNDSVLFQTFERILHDQVLEHVNCRNLLSDFKSGFRHGHEQRDCFSQSYRGFKVGEG
jgi:hypothetical protein